MHPARSPNAATNNRTKNTAAHPFLMFHYAILAVWESFFGRPKLQTDAFHSQTDARPEATPILIHSVHKLLQLVAEHEKSIDRIPGRQRSSPRFCKLERLAEQ